MALDVSDDAAIAAAAAATAASTTAVGGDNDGAGDHAVSGAGAEEFEVRSTMQGLSANGSPVVLVVGMRGDGVKSYTVARTSLGATTPGASSSSTSSGGGGGGSSGSSSGGWWRQLDGEQVAALVCVLLAVVIAGFEVRAGAFPRWLSCAWPCLLAAYSIRWWRRNRVVEESLLVVQDLGVQLRERRASGRETFQFIEKTRIKHVIINEGFTMCNIVFYMAFILHNNRTKMTIAFKHLQPRLTLLAEVFRSVSAVLNNQTDTTRFAHSPRHGHVGALGGTGGTGGGGGGSGAGGGGGGGVLALAASPPRVLDSDSSVPSGLDMLASSGGGGGGEAPSAVPVPLVPEGQPRRRRRRRSGDWASYHYSRSSDGSGDGGSDSGASTGAHAGAATASMPVAAQAPFTVDATESAQQFVASHGTVAGVGFATFPTPGTPTTDDSPVATGEEGTGTDTGQQKQEGKGGDGNGEGGGGGGGDDDDNASVHTYATDSSSPTADLTSDSESSEAEG